MDGKTIEMLHLEMEPVGIFFGNTNADCDIEASPEKRNCAVSFLVSAAKGKVVSMDEKSCNCAGGAVGCGFGDGFSRLNPGIHIMLSQGFGNEAAEEMPIFMKEGERFFCNADLAMKWRRDMPYKEKAYPRIVFAPMSKWEEIGKPDLVYVFANPDQISALVTLLGSHNGKALNTLAPFGAACHSIAYAADQMTKEEPMAIMGLFDISQRRDDLSNLLSITMPYELWDNLTEDSEKSCLTTHAWKEIEKRMKSE